MEPPNPVTILASLEIVQNQLANLEQVITKLVKLHADLPAGEARNRLLDEISGLDVILETMKRAMHQ